MTARASQYAGRAESYVINALVQFRDKRGALNYNVNKLKANMPRTDAPQALKDQYARTLALAQDAKVKADWLGALADQFTAITGLGALPALIAGVPVAVLLAAAAALTIIISKVVSEVSRYVGAAQAVEIARSAGRDPVAAFNAYNASAGSGGLFGDAAKLVWPLVIAGGIYLLISDKRK